MDEEDINLAQVMLPIARLLNKMSKEELEEMHTEFEDIHDMGPEMFITCVKKYAWRHGIRIKVEETTLCFCLLQDLPLTDSQLVLLEEVSDLLSIVDIGEGGVSIGKNS